MYDFLIVGAGLTGATIARILTDAGARVLVVEKRRHIAGNCHDKEIDGIFVNTYGGHIFHTNSDRIWQFVNRFCDWIPYEHRVKAFYRGKMYSLPPNKMTMQQLGLNGDDCHTQAVIRQTFFAGYSFKQWGRDLDSLPDSIIARIPIRDDYDDRYFGDRYQAMPAHGYTELVAHMLWGIPVELGCDYLGNRELDKAAKRIVYTGPIDALFDYQYGRLQYRSLRFEHTNYTGTYQGCATVNYTDYQPDYTRIMEWKYFGNRHKGINHTIVTVEYPGDTGDPYYPINDQENNDLHKRYAALAKESGFTVAGRLGRYQYLNMDQAIGQGMKTARRLINV